MILTNTEYEPIFIQGANFVRVKLFDTESSKIDENGYREIRIKEGKETYINMSLVSEIIPRTLKEESIQYKNKGIHTGNYWMSDGKEVRKPLGKEIEVYYLQRMHSQIALTSCHVQFVEEEKKQTFGTGGLTNGFQ